MRPVRMHGFLPRRQGKGDKASERPFVSAQKGGGEQTEG